MAAARFSTLWNSAPEAFNDPTAWMAYRAAAKAEFEGVDFGTTNKKSGGSLPRGSSTLKWLADNHQAVLAQMASRPNRPALESVGPMENYIDRLRRQLGRRTQVLGNRDRTLLLLRLLTAGHNGNVNAATWTDKVRTWLLDRNGTAPTQRQLVAPGGARTL